MSAKNSAENCPDDRSARRAHIPTLVYTCVAHDNDTDKHATGQPHKPQVFLSFGTEGRGMR